MKNKAIIAVLVALILGSSATGFAIGRNTAPLAGTETPSECEGVEAFQRVPVTPSKPHEF